MTQPRTIILFLGILASLTLITNDAFAADFYIAQSQSGNNNGTTCADAYSLAWFNTSANWANPKQTGKVGPGDVVHLCGTFTSEAAFQEGGSSGSPITVLFEDGAIFSYLPANNGKFISTNGKAYIVIDGGTNGIIEAIDNGTPSTYGGIYNNQRMLYGIYASGSHDIEIRKLTIRNLYVHTTPLDPANFASAPTAIYFNGVGNNISIHDCIFQDVLFCIGLLGMTPGASNANIYNNTFTNYDHGVTVTGSLYPGYSGVNIYNNHFGATAAWDTAFNNGCTDVNTPWSCCTGNKTGTCALTTTSKWHHDGVHLFLLNPYATSYLSDVNIYNNIFDGDWGICNTAHIFVEDRTLPTDQGGIWNTAIFNNVFQHTNSRMNNGSLTAPWKNGVVANNTVMGSGINDLCMTLGNLTSGSRIVNNMVSNCYVLTAQAVGKTNSSNLGHNVYAKGQGSNLYNWSPGTNTDCIGSGYPYACCTGSGTGTCSTSYINSSSLTTWQGWTGEDSSSSYVVDANLNSNGTLQAGSAARKKGIDLSSLGIPALKSDKNGVARPQGSAWDVGAYQYQFNLPIPTGLKLSK